MNAADVGDRLTPNILDVSIKKNFYNTQPFTESVFNKAYVESNCLGRIFYTYCTPTLNAVNDKDGRLDLEDNIDMNREGISIEEQVRQFNEQYAERVKEYEARGEQVDAYKVLRGTLWNMLKCETYWVIALATFTELITVGYSYFITFMIRYIRDPNREVGQGLLLIFIFTLAQVLAQLLRNRYIQDGNVIATKVRRILVGGLFDKVSKLSVKSMTETGSGKLISLISADLF